MSDERTYHYDKNGKMIGHSEKAGSIYPSSDEISKYFDQIGNYVFIPTILIFAIIGFIFCFKLTDDVITGIIGACFTGWIGFYVGGIISCIIDQIALFLFGHK